MGKDYILLLIFQDSRFLRDRNSRLLRVAGHHYHLDSRAVQHTHRLNRVCPDIVPQAEDGEQDLLILRELRHRQKLHGSLRLGDHLFFHLAPLCKGEFSDPAVFCGIMCDLADDILRGALPVDSPVMKHDCRTFLL